MDAVLLAAGLGTRLKPLTDLLPKCLAPIRGRPLLEYWLRLLFDAGVRRALVNTHHHADLVRRYILSGPWRGRVVLAHEDSLLGTGGTILANGDFIDTEPVIVAHADNLTAFDTTLFIAAHRVRQPGTF